jgi:hypothetical protein
MAKGLLRRAQIFVILRRRNVAVTVVVLVVRGLRVNEPDAHELLGMREGKAPEDEGVDDGELSGDAADAKREHGHREDTEHFLLNQNTETDVEVLEEGF